MKNNYETLKTLLLSNKEIARHFLRGIFDSEGSNTKNAIFFTVLDEELITLCKSLLLHHFGIRSNKFSFKQTSNYNPNEFTSWRLSITAYVYLKQYMKEIGFSIKRKNKIIKERTPRGGCWINEEIEYLKANHETSFDEEIAKALNEKFNSYRTKASITHKRQRLGFWRGKGWNQANLKKNIV